MTTGPGDASHADRERVIAALRAAFVQGRLTKDEFDSRVGRALVSRTHAELAALTADIPAGLTGPAARDALQPDARPRHRRRARRIAGSLAAIAVIVAAISVTSVGHRPAFVATLRPTGAVMYVAASNGMTPVETATNTRGKPIKIGAIPAAIAITPDGKTAYIVDLPAYGRGPTTVVPVATATNTRGRPIKISDAFGLGAAIAITPDGKTAYVVTAAHRGATVIPVATATNTPGKPINIGGGVPQTAAIAIAPDGKTAYIADGHHHAVIPVATATNTPGKPININGTAVAIAITPDGKTAYVATSAFIAGSCPGCP